MRRKSDRRTVGEEYFTFGFASKRSKPELFTTFHRHNEIELGYIERGWISVLFSSGTLVFRERQWHVFWGAMPHRNIASEPGTVMHWLTIPLAWFLEWQLPAALQRPLLDGAVLVDKTPGEDSHARSFERWHADLKSNTADARKLVLLEAEARLRRMHAVRATGQTETSTSRSSPPRNGEALRPAPQLGKVEQLAAFIAAHYREPLRVAEIAASAGLHPEYAVTLFRKTCGMGLVDYVTQHRISHAQRLLATTGMKIVDVAFASGFGSASRFYAAFEQLCRQSPKAYRSAMLSGNALTPPVPRRRNRK